MRIFHFCPNIPVSIYEQKDTMWLYYAIKAFVWIFIYGFTDPFNSFPMCNDSPFWYSIEIYVLLNSSPSHFSMHSIILMVCTNSGMLLELYTGTRKSYLNVETIFKVQLCKRHVLIHMDIGQHGYSMAMLIPWCSMFHLCPMVHHGKTMVPYGNSMAFHGVQGHIHGVSWKIYGVQWKALGAPWKAQGVPRNIFCKGVLGYTCINNCVPRFYSTLSHTTSTSM